MNKRYYLETNALRSLASVLPSDAFKKGIYSSFLAVSEIVSGLDENDFVRRMAILDRLTTTGFGYCRYSPESIMALSYGVLDVQSLLLEARFYEMMGSLCNYSTYSDFVESDEYQDVLRVLKARDEISGRFPHKVEETFLSKEEIASREFEKRWNKDQYARNLEIMENHFGGMMIDCFGKERVTKYDHSMDLFMLCFGWFMDRASSLHQLPGRNDYTDLQHIMYLGNSAVMVTDDKKLTGTIRAIDDSRVISIAEFRIVQGI